MKKAIVIGSGFTGCMFSMMLREKNWEVTVVEKSKLSGGGVRTFYHGGHPYTYGPRHFIGPESSMPAFEFLNKYIPMRHIKKMNYSYQAKDDFFAHYPIHEDDIKKLSDANKIFDELKNLPEESKTSNFEDFWISRVGKTLYERFNKFYNLKAWNLKSNTEMDSGFEGTVKRKPLETGSKYEFHTGHINAYPESEHGYNNFFDIALKGCDLLLGKTITKVDLDNTSVVLDDGKKLTADLIISTISPDFLFNYSFGELAYVGRDFFKIVLPIENVLPQDVYFLYYPNEGEQQTRVTEFKKFTRHKSPNTLITMEVPSMKNKLYPTMIKSEVDRAKKYIDALPESIKSVGRMGTYRYVDIDDIILQGLEFKKSL
jgi:UDP-galactopyranose mutase